MTVSTSARRVLLVDPDVDALGALASALRARGLSVTVASEVFEAVEVAFQQRPDVIVVVETLEHAKDLAEALRVTPEVHRTPLLPITPSLRDAVHAGDDRADVDLLISRISDLSPRSVAGVVPQDLRGNLQQMGLPDLLQLLTMNRNTGVVSLTAPSGVGELRVDSGELVDAAFRRFEGEKALVRLLGEREGQFAFTPGAVASSKRFKGPVSMLIMDALRQVDEVSHRRRALGSDGEALLLHDLVGDAPMPKRPELAELPMLLRTPRTLDDILDELPCSDLIILDALVELDQGGHLRHLPWSSLATPVAPPEQLPALRALVTRLVKPGFAAPPRLIIATKPRHLPALAHAIRRVMDAVTPVEAPPRVPTMRILGTLRLGDGVELAIAGLPVDDAFSPTWAVALPGAGAVVRLDEAGGASLEATCQQAEVLLLEGESLMGAVDVAVPEQVIALVRFALEAAAGV